MTETISKIEDALYLLAENPKGSWGELLKGWKTPYYNCITPYLSKRGICVAEGTGLRWVGDKPTRVLAGLIYEEAKTGAAPKVKKPMKPTKKELAIKALYGEAPAELITPVAAPKRDELTRGLAIIEHAIKAGVIDPVAFARKIIADSRI